VWYEVFTVVNNKWLWLVGKNKKLNTFYKDDIACAVIVMYSAFVAGVLPGFEEITFLHCVTQT
jgi:hypothetical protein